MAHHDHCHVASSQKALMLEMKSLQDQPVEGFKITLVDEADMYNWEVAVFGPPNTHYEGGYFKVQNCRRIYILYECCESKCQHTTQGRSLPSCFHVDGVQH